ncbi:hypothetical protein E2C01_028071 [Portunus trituberculatus]|uniref:Uncharacterized protein n=1 Tax=Portunus trituberculatus TaxID=210409 RepID=A0A5B7EKE1_PORTR|nr:hypothetical protein [Portunus trituberculatus]
MYRKQGLEITVHGGGRLESIQCSLTVNKEIYILTKRCHNMVYLQNSTQFCPSRGHVWREPPGNLIVSVVIGRNVVMDEQPTSGPAATHLITQS